MKYKQFFMATAIILTIAFSACKKELNIKDAGNLVQKTVDQDPSLPFIEVNGAKLHAEAFGPPDSAMIVVLHGGPGNDYRYLLNCKAFAYQGYRVIFFDQRGAGLSQRFPYSTYNMDLAHEDLRAVIAHYRTSPGQRVFLLGQSWGAMLATAYINLYPNEIQGAILSEPGGFIWQDVLDYVSRVHKLEYLSEEMNDATYTGQFITGGNDEHAILDYKHSLLDAAAEKGGSLGNEGRVPYWRRGSVTYKAYFDMANKAKPDWTTNLHKYTTKVLFMYSENNSSYGLGSRQKSIFGLSECKIA
jgi:proline iminopeptidase